jgi:cysteinyl-tRNA synthetase
MSKSKGGFTTLFSLIDAGVHPLAYRLLCLSAHYRSELEFSGEIVATALTRLKRLVMAVERVKTAAQAPQPVDTPLEELLNSPLEAFGHAIADDLNTPRALAALEELLANKSIRPTIKLNGVYEMDKVLGLKLGAITRADLRVRPKDAVITEAEIETALDRRQTARADKDFAASDAIRDDLLAKGVEVMDGDPLRWEWKVEL